MHICRIDDKKIFNILTFINCLIFQITTICFSLNLTINILKE